MQGEGRTSEGGERVSDIDRNVWDVWHCRDCDGKFATPKDAEEQADSCPWCGYGADIEPAPEGIA